MLVTRGTEPREVVPMLLDALEGRDPDRADFIKDVYSEVLKGLRRDDVKDPEMLEWLVQALTHHLNETTGPDEFFGESPAGSGLWGFWPVEQAGSDESS